jgi:beta-glucosidase
VGQIPLHYNHKNTGRPFQPDIKYSSQYLDTENDPLYPFGFGLSFTTFHYGPLDLSGSKLRKHEKITASLTLTNTGPVEAVETVQLYIRDTAASITRPVKELKGFQQIRLAPGASSIVRFDITESMLRFYNSDLDFVSEPGRFEVLIGPNSREAQRTDFHLIP